MEITFEKVNEHRYEAYFEAPGDFNLHVERVKNGTLEVYQRGIAEGEYDFAWSAGIGARKVIDYDFAAFVYPKWIKVVSSSEVVSASVNFNEGGGSGSGSSDNVKYFMLANDNYAELFQFEEGMTFGDWCNSKYNQFGFVYEQGGWLNMENVHNSIFTTTIIGQTAGEIYGYIYDENSQDTLDLEIDDTTPITANASYHFKFPK